MGEKKIKRWVAYFIFHQYGISTMGNGSKAVCSAFLCFSGKPTQLVAEILLLL
jgi:hypothetical protein